MSNATLPLLTYSVLSNPDPIQSGAACALTIVVSNSSNVLIECATITISLAVGVNAKDLTADATGVEPVRQTGWNVTRDGRSFLCQPTAPLMIGRDAVTFVLTGIAVINQPGLTQLDITEVAARPNQPMQTSVVSLSLPKFPAGFALAGPIADPVSVQTGESSTISWVGGPAGYTLTYNPSSGAPVVVPDLGAIGSYVAHNLSGPQPVIFTLDASVPVPNDQPLHVQRQVAVTIEALPPVIDLFVVQVHREQVRLIWRTQNAVECRMQGLPTMLVPSGATGFAQPGAFAFALTAVAQSGVTAVSATRSLRWGSLGVSSLNLNNTQFQPLFQNTNDQPLICALATSADGRTLYVSITMDPRFESNNVPGALIAVDTTSWATLTQSPYINASFAMAMSADGGLLYVDEGSQLSWLSPVTLQSQNTTNGFPNQLGFNVFIGVSMDGSVVCTATYSAFATYDTTTGTVIQGGIAGYPATGVILSPDATRAYVTTQAPALVCVMDAHSAVLLSQLNLTDIPSALAISPDGSTLYVGLQTAATIEVIDVATLTVRQSISVTSSPIWASATSDGTYLMVVSATPGAQSAGTGMLTVIDIASMAVVQQLPTQANPTLACMAPVGGRIYVFNLGAVNSENEYGGSTVETFAIVGAV
jgi:YVTN family beta-propeller protein